MLFIILADSGLELIPKGMGKQAAVGKNIRRFGDAGKIMDISLHHSAMKGLMDPHSRGRPDIVQKFIIDALSSPLNKWNMLRIFIHTRDNRLFEVNPLMRPPKEYYRFKGIMYKLLKEDAIKIPLENKIQKEVFLNKESIEKFTTDKELQKLYLKPMKINNISKMSGKKKEKQGDFEQYPMENFLDLNHFVEEDKIVLMRRMKKSVKKLIKFIHADRTLMFTKQGELKQPDELFKGDPTKKTLAIVGGFQRGTFSEQYNKISSEKTSIFPSGLESWAVINRIITNYENFLLNSMK